MYSPTRNGLVKMMVSPATRFWSTPWRASPTPTPATPRPAIRGISSTPRFCIARIMKRAKTTSRTIRTSRSRTGGSICRFSSQWEKVAPTQRAVSEPATTKRVATTSLGP